MTERTRRKAPPAVTLPDVFAGRAFVSSGEIAKVFGYTSEHVRREVRKGRLVAIGSGRGRRITVESVRAWMGAMWRERWGETVPEGAYPSTPESPEKL